MAINWDELKKKTIKKAINATLPTKHEKEKAASESITKLVRESNTPIKSGSSTKYKKKDENKASQSSSSSIKNEKKSDTKSSASSLPTKTSRKNGSKANRSSNKRRLTDTQRKYQEEQYKTKAVPQAIARFTEKAINDVALAPVSIPYQIATGKKLVDMGLEPTTKSAKTGAKVGSIAGDILSYGTGYKAAEKAVGKAAGKALATKTGKKAVEKAAASKVGKKVGEETVKKVAESATKGAIADATVGTTLNLSHARGKGLEGEELAKDMALNAALDLGVGGAIEALPIAKALVKNKSGKKALKTIADDASKTAKTASESVEKTVNAELPTKTAKEAENAPKTASVSPEYVDEDYMEYLLREAEKLPKERYVKTARSTTLPTKETLNENFTLDNFGFDHWENEKEVKKAIRELNQKAKKGTLTDDDKWNVVAILADNAQEASGGLSQEVKELQKYLRTLPISIEDTIKRGIPDGYNNLRKANFGNLRLSNKGQDIDTVYNSLREEFPGVLKGAETQEEQLEELVKLAKQRASYTNAYETIPPTDLANGLYKLLNNNLTRKPVDYRGKLRTINSKNVTPQGTKTVSSTAPTTNNIKLKDLGADIARPNQTIAEAGARYGTYDGTVPKETELGKVTQGASTVYNSPISNDEMKKVISENIEEGSYWTRRTTNKDNLNKAADAIKENGLDKETESFLDIGRKDRAVKSEDIAMGYQLAKEHINKGNYETAQAVLSDVCQMESEAGRALQSMRLFNSLSPEGRVKSVLRSADKIAEHTGRDIKVSDEMLDRLRNAAKEEAGEIKKQINEELWNQVPATFAEKLTAWRYLAMLGNPRTHIRNIVGNALYVPVVRMDNVIQAGLQKAMSGRIERLGGKKTSAILTSSKSDRELKKFASEQFDELRKTIDTGSNKYNEEYRPQGSRVFKSNILERVNNINSSALEAEDQAFMKLSFDSAFAQYCKANKKTVDNLTDEFVKEASEHAYDEALRATYRDPSRLAEALSKFRRNLDTKATDTSSTKALKTAGKVVVDSALPFTKTPINILRRGVSHSPLGLSKGIVDIAGAKDAQSLQKAITQVAEGLTGTGVMALGMYMGNQSYANGSLGEYGSEYKWQQLLGKQDYALNVGDYSVTMDWAAPICMPFFVGVELGNSILREKGNVWDAIEGLSTIYEPVLEMSMLSGVQNLFDFSNGDSKDIVTFMGNAAQNLGSQFIPTLLGQVARTAVPERKIALSTAENKLQRNTEKYIDKMENKIPGLTNTNESYVDMFGRTESKENPLDYVKAGLENFLSPAYITKRNDGTVETQLEDLRQSLGSEGKEVLPTDYSSNYDIRYDGTDYRMNEKQFTEYKKVRGQAAREGLNELFNSAEYKAMSNADRKKAIKDVYEQAKDYAKRETVIAMGVVSENEYDYNSLSKVNKEIVDSGKATVKEVKAASQIVKDSGYSKSVGKAYALLSNGTSESVAAMMTSERAVKNAARCKQAGVTPEVLDKVASYIDTNGNGSYTKDEIMAFFNANGAEFTQAQKAAIFMSLNTSKYNPY